MQNALCVSLDMAEYFCLLVLIFFIFLKLFPRTRYPPGPSAKFLIGNIYDLPSVRPWETYSEWKRQYGDIVYARAFTQDIILINSFKVAKDVLEGRSRIYSDRPQQPMRDILGWSFVVGLMSYGPVWRENRKVFQQYYRPDAITKIQHIQTRQTYQFLRNLLKDPSNFEAHYRHLAASIIMETLYGYETSPQNDRFLETADNAITMMTNSQIPGSSLVMLLPFLRHFIFYSEQAKRCRNATRMMLDAPFDFVTSHITTEDVSASLTSKLLHLKSDNDEQIMGDDFIKGIGATAFSAGADTVACVIGIFMYAAVVNPECQKKAQHELDLIVGRDRLPDFSDRDRLPYLEAFYRELMRWRPAMPMGVPHATTEADMYGEFFIPKGATILTNIWAMTRDAEKYPNPDQFNPERFLNADGNLNNDDFVLTYGFGRRRCVGRYAAEASIWIAMATVLATFDLTTAIDEDGNDIAVTHDFTDALISHKLPFKCSIIPRSVIAAKLVQETLAI